MGYYHVLILIMKCKKYWAVRVGNVYCKQYVWSFILSLLLYCSSEQIKTAHVTIAAELDETVSYSTRF
jgi:hypothetical protein